MRYTVDRVIRSKDTISVTGNNKARILAQKRFELL